MTPPAIARPPRRRFAGTRRRARGTTAVIALVLSAADVLMSAFTGWPRIGPAFRQLGRALADAYRRAARLPLPVRIYVTSTGEDIHHDQH